MFLTDKYHALLPIHSPAKDHRKAAAPAPASRFEAALAARLGSLLPLPVSPLAALARLADLLAAMLGDAVPALSSAGQGDASVAAHLDAGIALLDACNAITSRIDRLRRRRLLSRLALHHLSSSSSASSVQRARAALADRDVDGASSSPPLPLSSLPFVDPPRSAGRQLTAAARVILALNAVSSLAAAAAATILGSGGKLSSASFPLVVYGDLSWAEAFNAVSSQLATLTTAKTCEVEAVDEAVSKLATILEGGGAEKAEAAVRGAAQEVEKRTQELAALLDRLSDAVKGVFRAALRLRNAELGSFAAVGPAEKTRKK